MRFVLASASPARLATLRRAGVEPEVIVSGVDEDAVRADSTAELVLELARRKARAVAERLDGPALVLGCDSMLDLHGNALGKPGSAQAARERWHELRGNTGTLLTGHWLVDTSDDREVGEAAGTVVSFADVNDTEIDLYVRTGEPSSVAGAFTVDGLGGWFVTGVEGDQHNVVGVSLPLLRDLLHRLGLGLTDIGYPGR